MRGVLLSKEFHVEPFKGCEKCSSTNGIIYTQGANGVEARKCQCLIDYQKNQYFRLQLHRANIPETDKLKGDINNYIGTDSLDSIRKIRKYVDEFGHRYNGEHLYLYGPNSTQKTTVAWWIGRELIRKGFGVYYVLMDNLLRDLLQESFDEEVKPRISTYRDVDVLIVDEAFDKGKIVWYKSDYQLSFLDGFLRNRLEHNRKSTVFVSNQDVASLRRVFNNSIYELITRETRYTQLPFNDHYAKKENFDPQTSFWS